MTPLDQRDVLLREEVVTATPVTTSEVVSEQRVVAHTAATEFDLFDAVRKFIAFAGLVVAALLAIRIMLMAIGANPDAGFAELIYGVTGPMVSPFDGVVGDRSTDGGVFDGAAAVAMLVYVLAMVLAMLFASLLGGSMPRRRESVTRSEHLIQKS